MQDPPCEVIHLLHGTTKIIIFLLAQNGLNHINFPRKLLKKCHFSLIFMSSINFNCFELFLSG